MSIEEDYQKALQEYEKALRAQEKAERAYDRAGANVYDARVNLAEITVARNSMLPAGLYTEDGSSPFGEFPIYLKMGNGAWYEYDGFGLTFSDIKWPDDSQFNIRVVPVNEAIFGD